MKLEDFAIKNSVESKSGGTKRWDIKDKAKLVEYLTAYDYRLGKLATELKVSFSTLRQLVVVAGLLDKCVVSKQQKAGGRKRTTAYDKFGYLYAGPEHDFIDKRGDKKRKHLHSVVAEQKLNRPLNPDETVHHVNLDKKDNRPENLHICSQSTHRKIHHDLECLAGRLVETGQIAFVPELEQYVHIGPKPNLEKHIQGGFVKVVDLMGSDATVVNAARVSFGKTINMIRDQDKKLLDYLSTHGHSSPFRHCYVQLHVKAPEFVARQWYKHIVGTEYSFKDQPWNEISGRYVEYDYSSWEPESLRKQSKDKKQGSSDETVENEVELIERYKKITNDAHAFYHELIAKGVCKEQARTVLPVNFYTEWYWTASLQSLQHFVKLRTDPHAQAEIQDFAWAVNDMMTVLFPNAWKALNLNNGKNNEKAVN